MGLATFYMPTHECSIPQAFCNWYYAGWSPRGRTKMVSGGSCGFAASGHARRDLSQRRRWSSAGARGIVSFAVLRPEGRAHVRHVVESAGRVER